MSSLIIGSGAINESTEILARHDLQRLQSFRGVVQRPVSHIDATWVEEKECLILLLKARMMLRDIVMGRLKQGLSNIFFFLISFVKKYIFLSFFFFLKKCSL